jgi:pSer/pThr/pTyr-binding forkhead associated (FHA) protein
VSLTVKEKEKVFELHEGTHSIGRTDDNKIILSYASISKKHALLGKQLANLCPTPLTD